jgi:hypothetical protein
MFLRPNHRGKAGKDHTYWSLVETVRTAEGPRQKTLCYLGELNSSAQARWLRTVDVFNEQGETQQLKLFPSHVDVPRDDPQVARVLLNEVRLERTRQFGGCYLGLQLWKRLELDRFFEQAADDEPADVPWSRVAALLVINRLCAPGSELAIEQRWYPSTALDDLLAVEEGKINDTRLYRCLDRILPHKTKLEQHLKQRYGELFGAEFDVLLYDLTSTYVEGAAEKNPMMRRGYSRDHRPDCEQMVIALIVNNEGFPFSYETAEQLWSKYMQLTEAEASFRALKSELSIRPLFHQLEPRVKAHVMVAFLGYALWVTLKHLLKRRPAILPKPSGSGVDNAQPLSLMRALALLSTLQSADIVLPTTDGHEIRLRRITEPTAEQKSLLQQLGISLPDRLEFNRKCSVDSAIA